MDSTLKSKENIDTVAVGPARSAGWHGTIDLGGVQHNTNHITMCVPKILASTHPQHAIKAKLGVLLLLTRLKTRFILNSAREKTKPSCETTYNIYEN